MKSLVFFVVMTHCLLGCSEKRGDTLTLLEPSDEDFGTYEGNVIFPDGEVVEAELYLTEASPGVDADYKINGFLVSEDYVTHLQGKGKYEAVPLGNGLFGIRLMGAKTGHMARSDAFFTKNIDRLRTKPYKDNDFISVDLYFITSGDGRLSSTDENFTAHASDDRYTLFRRSNLFTIEGYATLNPDCTMEFFERNTFQNWSVAPLGIYQQLEENYVELAKEAWEGIYIRAVAYSVSASDSTGQNRDLVVKKLIAVGDNP